MCAITFSETISKSAPVPFLNQKKRSRIQPTTRRYQFLLYRSILKATFGACSFPTDYRRLTNCSPMIAADDAG